EELDAKVTEVEGKLKPLEGLDAKVTEVEGKLKPLENFEEKLKHLEKFEKLKEKVDTIDGLEKTIGEKLEKKIEKNKTSIKNIEERLEALKAFEGLQGKVDNIDEKLTNQQTDLLARIQAFKKLNEQLRSIFKSELSLDWVDV
ncbi:MAG: hypothetical protein REH83_02800, partial [Rickettsiella sp.]|nr:hypothetical protein [Rickettsiella sp.]